MRTKENDIFQGGVEKIKKPTPHRLKALSDPAEFKNFEDSGVHHLKPWLAFIEGGSPKARRP